MSQKHIDKLIINDAYTEPIRHWAYLREKQEFELRDGRRKAGYWKLSGVGRKGTDDLGEFVEMPLVNQVRPRVQEWKEKGFMYYTTTKGEKLKLNYSFFEDAEKVKSYEEAAKITIPTIIVHGDKDKNVPIEQSKELTKIIKDY